MVDITCLLAEVAELLKQDQRHCVALSDNPLKPSLLQDSVQLTAQTTATELHKIIQTDINQMEMVFTKRQKWTVYYGVNAENTKFQWAACVGTAFM